jgi:O-antigen ligase
MIVFFLACFAFWPARAGILAYFIYGGSGFGGRTAWKGLFGNPNDLAAISLLPLSMCIGLFFSARNRALQLASFAGVGVLSMVVVLTQSRGALVAMLVFALASLLTTRGKQRIRLAVAFAVVSAAAVPFIPQSAWERYAGLLKIGGSKTDLTAAGDQGSADQRFEIWKVARRITGEHLLTGVGFGAYKLEHRLVAMRPEFRPTARGGRDPHSTYFAVAAETGLPGLVSFFGVFAAAVLFAERVRRAARQARPDDAMLLLYLQLGLLAYFVAGIWGSYEKVPITYVHAAVLWAFASVVRRALAQQGVPVR